ncbi:MAG: hypothetical protein JO332_18685, partial [Planctomycetaceae bacterium]|nr:hypothetical protein [Planctomycetaceae bacterium]
VSGGALIGTRRYRDAAAALIAGLLGMFTVALVASMVRGTAGACGCFGSSVAFLNRPDVSLVRNLFLIAAVIWVIAPGRKPTSGRSGPASPA